MMIYIRAISEQLAENMNVPDKPGLGIDVDEDAIANSPLNPDNYMSTRYRRRDCSVTNW